MEEKTQSTLAYALPTGVIKLSLDLSKTNLDTDLVTQVLEEFEKNAVTLNQGWLTIDNSESLPLVLKYSTNSITEKIDLISNGFCKINWGDGMTSNIFAEGKTQSDITHPMVTTGRHTIVIRGEFKTLKLHVENNALEVEKFVAPSSMNDCSNLFSNLGTSKFDVCDMLNITNATAMLKNVGSIETITLQNSNHTLNMQSMLQANSSLKTVYGTDLSLCTDASYMFDGCSALTTVEFTTGKADKVITAQNMFGMCKNLVSIPVKLEMSACNNMSNMFNGCSALNSVNGIDTSAAVNTKAMFYGCESLKELPAMDFSKSTNVSEMFKGCSSLVTLSNLDFSSVTTSTNVGNETFRGCKELRYVTFAPNSIKTNISFNESPLLEKSSILSIINALATVASGNLLLHTDCIAQLTADELAIATNKGWTVAANTLAARTKAFTKVGKELYAVPENVTKIKVAAVSGCYATFNVASYSSSVTAMGTNPSSFGDLVVSKSDAPVDCGGIYYESHAHDIYIKGYALKFDSTLGSGDFGSGTFSSIYYSSRTNSTKIVRYVTPAATFVQQMVDVTPGDTIQITVGGRNGFVLIGYDEIVK